MRSISSPLQRTQQSAEPIARVFGLEAALDERVIEPENRFEGKRMSGRDGALRDVRNWAFLVNPWEPSWGEPFVSIATRMLHAMDDAWNATEAGDAVIVSHQLPDLDGASPGGRQVARARPAPSALRPVEHHHVRATRRHLRRGRLPRPGGGARRPGDRRGGGVMRALSDSRPSPRRADRRPLGLAALAAASALLLAGCASDPLAEQFREGSGKNYIAGDGTISEFAEPQRGEPIEFSGDTVEGGTFDSADTLGEVTVVNFWYAGCAPCRVEAPILEEVSQQFGDDAVSFVGVNVRDQAGTAASFEETYGVTYPSILDVESGDRTARVRRARARRRRADHDRARPGGPRRRARAGPAHRCVDPRVDHRRPPRRAGVAARGAARVQDKGEATREWAASARSC